MLNAYSDNTSEPQTLSDCMEQWIQERTGTVRDVYNEHCRWKTHVHPAAFAHKPIDQVGVGDIRSFLKKLSEHKSEQTCRHVLRQIKQTFTYAQEKGFCLRNPATTVKVPKQDRTEDAWTYLQPEEIGLLINAPGLTDQERRAALIAIYTGLRLGELLHLRWEDVHLDGRRPHIMVRYSNGKATKSGKPGRTPLLPMAIVLFQEMGPAAQGLVLPNAQGRAFAKGYDFGWRDRKDNSGKLKPGSKTRAGIARKVRFHDLRHTTAAALISGYWGDAWSLEEIQDFMRHSNIGITQRYAHLDPARLHDKAASMCVRPSTEVLVETSVASRTDLRFVSGAEPVAKYSVMQRLELLEALVAGYLLGSPAPRPEPPRLAPHLLVR